ncbi:MAG: 1-acyl-sn-glycerol-3-phosphate acyltransferase [Alphaproteobacteria bacterium]|nr:MAG: 1-acyl-sn-glycerol-3-phosphate acyltransferase [Alphaproteobacteria bacterium]
MRSVVYIRSALYLILFLIATMCIALWYAPCLWSKKHHATKARIPLLWTKIALTLQKHILDLDYEVRTHTPLPQGGVVYAVKHQSAWETIALWHIIDRPVFVLKKELLSIPLFGAYLAASDHIAIDRTDGIKAIQQINSQVAHFLAQGRNVVMFPEGTRTSVGEDSRYKSGIALLYHALSPTLYPVALNSGCFWSRNAWVRKAGTVEVEILPPMPSGLDKQAFMRSLKEQIEGTTTQLVEHARLRS